MIPEPPNPRESAHLEQQIKAIANVEMLFNSREAARYNLTILSERFSNALATARDLGVTVRILSEVTGLSESRIQALAVRKFPVKNPFIPE